MIYKHYDKMPEILYDYNHEFEGEHKAVEQDNGKWSKHMINALEELTHVDNSRDIAKWFKEHPFKTATCFDRRTWFMERRSGLEVVK